MDIPERKTKSDKKVVKQTFIQLTIEVFLSIIFGDIVTKLTGGLVLLIGGPIIYYLNSELIIGKIIGITFPIIGLMMIVAEIRDVKREIKKNLKSKP